MCSLLLKLKKLPEEESCSKEQCQPGSWQKSPRVVQSGDIYCPAQTSLQGNCPWQDGFAICLPSSQVTSRFWKGNTHLQFLGYRKGLVQNIPQHQEQLETGGCELHTASLLVFLGTHSQEMLPEQQEGGDNCMRCHCKGTPVGMKKIQPKQKNLQKDWGFSCEPRKYQSLCVTLTTHRLLPCPAFTGLIAPSCGSNQDFDE